MYLLTSLCYNRYYSQNFTLFPALHLPVSNCAEALTLILLDAYFAIGGGYLRDSHEENDPENHRDI